MLFGQLLTSTAQMFSDVRTYWSPDAVERTTGVRPTGRAGEGFIHLINSGPTALDATGEQRDDQGNPAIKPYWQITPQEAAKCLDATLWRPAVWNAFGMEPEGADYRACGNFGPLYN